MMMVVAAARAEETKYVLAPKWKDGDYVEVEGKFVLEMSVRLEVPKAGIARTTTQVQAYGHKLRDKVLRVSPAGSPLHVKRHYLESWTALQEPGERAPTRSAGPLDRQRLELEIDEKGKLVVLYAGKDGGRIPEGSTDGERITERWEGVLPPKAVAVGESWKLKGEQLGRLFEALGAKPEGELEAKLSEVKDKVLEKDAKPEKVAILAIKIDAKRVGADDDPTLQAKLAGTLEFALDRQKIVALDLKGEGIMDEERRDEKGGVMTIKGRGPLEVMKKVRFPKLEERGDKK